MPCCRESFNPVRSFDIPVLGKTWTYWSGGGHLGSQEWVVEGQSELGLFSLEKTKVTRDLVCLQLPHEGTKRRWRQILLRSSQEQKRNKSTQAGTREILIKCKEFFNSQKEFLNKLSEEILEYLSLEVFRT